MLMDVGRKIDVWYECSDLDTVQVDIGGNKILDYFRDVFRGMCAYQSLADDMHDDEIDNVVIKTAGETQKSYNAHLKRDARKQLRQEEAEDDDDDEPQDDEDDDE